jgi:hypothetical protein
MLEVSVRANTPTFSIVRGRKNAWINFLFEASALPSVWNDLRPRALKHRSLGAALRRSASSRFSVLAPGTTTDCCTTLMGGSSSTASDPLTTVPHGAILR